MKKYVKASRSRDLERRTVDRYTTQFVRNIAKYFYDGSNFSDDSPYADYFVENICEDEEVKMKQKELVEVLFRAKDRAIGYPT